LRISRMASGGTGRWVYFLMLRRCLIASVTWDIYGSIIQWFACSFIASPFFQKVRAAVVLVVDCFYHGFAAAFRWLLHVARFAARAANLIIRAHFATAFGALEHRQTVSSQLLLRVQVTKTLRNQYSVNAAATVHIFKLIFATSSSEPTFSWN
jgi:hypothetical protein